MARGASGAVSRLQASQLRDMPFKRWILHRSSSSLCISDEQRSSCGLSPAVGSDIQMFHLTPTIPAEGNNTHDASGWAGKHCEKTCASRKSHRQATNKILPSNDVNETCWKIVARNHHLNTCTWKAKYKLFSCFKNKDLSSMIRWSELLTTLALFTECHH